MRKFATVCAFELFFILAFFTTELFHVAKQKSQVVKNDRTHKKNHTAIQKKQVVKNNGMIREYCCVGFVRAHIAHYEKFIHTYNKITETKTKVKTS